MFLRSGAGFWGEERNKGFTAHPPKKGPQPQPKRSSPKIGIVQPSRKGPAPAEEVQPQPKRSDADARLSGPESVSRYRQGGTEGSAGRVRPLERAREESAADFWAGVASAWCPVAEPARAHRSCTPTAVAAAIVAIVAVAAVAGALPFAALAALAAAATSPLDTANAALTAARHGTVSLAHIARASLVCRCVGLVTSEWGDAASKRQNQEWPFAGFLREAQKWRRTSVRTGHDPAHRHLGSHPTSPRARLARWWQAGSDSDAAADSGSGQRWRGEQRSCARQSSGAMAVVVA